MTNRAGLLRVDAQIHAGLPRYRAIEECMAALDAEGIDQAVLVQQMGLADNTDIERSVLAFPGRLVGVAGLPGEPASLVGAVEAISRSTAFTSVRVPARLAGTLAAGPLFESLRRHGLAATIQGSYAEIAEGELASAIEECPGLPFVLEHVAGYRYGADDLGGLLALARHPTVTVMLSCFYRFAGDAYPHPSAHDAVARVLEAFGADRVMWSGDLNRAEQRLSAAPDDYERAIALVALLIDGLSETERAAVWGGTAARVYRLPPISPYK